MQIIHTSFKCVILLFFFCLASNIYATNDTIFQIDKRIILQKGLSQSRVHSIIEDERGFMWFGTADGLNRYDGYTFKIFRNIFNDTTSLPSNIINSMVEDIDGNIWIGTNNGVVLFNPYTETFKSIIETDSTAVSHGANIINSVAIDSDNNIWYCSPNYGISKIDYHTLKTEKLLFYTDNTLQIKNILKIDIDGLNRLWISSSICNIVYAYNITENIFEEYPVDNFANHSDTNDIITSFYEDKIGRIWTCITDNKLELGGIYYLDKGTKKFKSYNQFISKEFLSKHSQEINSVVAFVNDDEGNLWFASMYSGLFKIKYGESPIVYYNSLNDKYTGNYCLYRSKNGILWIGTNGYGIELSIPHNTVFNLISNETNDNFSIKSIRTFTEDKDYYWVGGYFGLSKINKDFSKIQSYFNWNVYTLANNVNNNKYLWYGSEGNGFNSIDKATESFSAVKLNLNGLDRAMINFLYVIYPVNDTLILLGALEGLFGYNPISGNLINYSDPKQHKTRKSHYAYFSSSSNIEGTTVRSITEDRFGNILIGYTQGGVGKLNLKEKRVEKFNALSNFKTFSKYNPINCIYQDKNNTYWMATNNGLAMFNPTTNTSRVFTEADGLPNSHIYSILPDDEDNLWLSTNNGLSCYNVQEGIFRNYNESDGLQDNEFNTGAYYKANDGTLFFGGIKGFNYFNPKNIKQNSIMPELVITGIKISNKYLKLTKKELSQRKLIIQPNQEVVTIEFAGLSFVNSDKNQYIYKIKELNKEWIQLGNSHQITFNNMSPGTYTLEILASNNHGKWLKKPFTYTIVVLPTFLESVYFKWLLAVIIVLIFIIGYRIRVRQITNQRNKIRVYADTQTKNLKKSNESLKVEIHKHKTTSNELAASNKTKDKFLSIMAHDIISPLGVILGFSDLLNQKDDDFSENDKSSFIQTINITAKGLSSLISNLLQWSRLQNDTINPKPTSIGLRNITLETTNLLKGNLEEKDINLKTDIDNKIKILADSNMISTIIRNLVSNAIKFTPNNGEICIKAVHVNNMIQISIIDNGIGIPKEKLDMLFNHNKTYTTKGTNNESGTGLGLVLVYDFVILSGGKIWVKSEINKGTVFHFTMPIDD